MCESAYTDKADGTEITMKMRMYLAMGLSGDQDKFGERNLPKRMKGTAANERPGALSQ